MRVGKASRLNSGDSITQRRRRERERALGTTDVKDRRGRRDSRERGRGERHLDDPFVDTDQCDLAFPMLDPQWLVEPQIGLRGVASSLSGVVEQASEGDIELLGRQIDRMPEPLAVVILEPSPLDLVDESLHDLLDAPQLHAEVRRGFRGRGRVPATAAATTSS